MKILRILDEKTVFLKWSISNETLSCQLALCQLVIVLVSLAQHIFSLVIHGHVFLCQFNRTDHPTEYSNFLAYDVIIFDFGLFHKILGVDTCIANYIDGGYMRCMWCIGQTLAIIILLTLPCLARVPPPWLLWPMLTMENLYCIGLIIFTIAITDKLIHAILHDLTGHLVWLALIYWLGTATNCFLDYVLWHFYWHLEEEYKRICQLRKEADQEQTSMEGQDEDEQLEDDTGSSEHAEEAAEPSEDMEDEHSSVLEKQHVVTIANEWNDYHRRPVAV